MSREALIIATRKGSLVIPERVKAITLQYLSARNFWKISWFQFANHVHEGCFT